jgi:hypothetical protein
MSDLYKAAQQALEFCEFLWREVAMNDYAEEQRERIETALRAALAQQVEVERLRVDAERYRWLKANGGEPDYKMEGASPETYDEILDRYIAESKEGNK